MKTLCLLIAIFITSSAYAVPEQEIEANEAKKPIGTILIEPEEKKPEVKKDAEKKPVVPAKKPAAPTKKLAKVKTELFEAKLELAGVVESETNTPIRVIPKAWLDLTVQEVVAHGTKVQKGDVILRFETEKLERAIEDQEAAIPLAELKLEAAVVDLELLEKTSPISFEAKRKSHAQRVADFAYFEEVRRPTNERNARERLKSYQNYLSYSEEELKQLKKMYENDDMTEETEEIILKRAQDSVDRDRWDVEQMKISTDRTLNISIPREHESLKRSLKLNNLQWEVEEEKAERAIHTKKLELEEQERAMAKSTEKLADLKEDLEALIVSAPHDGIIYYGASVKGKWTTAATVSKKLIPGGRASAREILLTLVDPDKLQVRVAVAEDKLKDLEEGQKAKLELKWNPDKKMDAKVESISYVPQSNATFDTVFSFEKADKKLPVYPGMNGILKMDVYKNPKALVVPIKAVKKEGSKAYVIKKDGTKHYVELGRANKEKQEIKSGLEAGDEIEADISARKDDKK